MRRKIVAGNWKMNKSVAEASDLAGAIGDGMPDPCEAEVVLCPPFTALKTVGDRIANTAINLGAQNMHWEKEGAFTGEISAGMLRDLYCHFVVVGHSERRALFGETDADVNRKTRAALAGSLTPIVCVGETLAERDAGRTEAVVRGQVLGSLAGLGGELAKIVIAYEPVWAIGTGRTASPQQAQEVHLFVRGLLRELGGAGAHAVRILYGGSVKASNAKEIFAQPDVDGGLVGGASLEATSFLEIVRGAM